ncbi:hypothetical protein YPPY72_2536, partial [Yersinia pestis PY-72]
MYFFQLAADMFTGSP